MNVFRSLAVAYLPDCAMVPAVVTCLGVVWLIAWQLREPRDLLATAGMTCGGAAMLLRDIPLAFRLTFLLIQIFWMSFYLSIVSVPGMIESSITTVSVLVALLRFHVAGALARPA